MQLPYLARNFLHSLKEEVAWLKRIYFEEFATKRSALQVFSNLFREATPLFQSWSIENIEKNRLAYLAGYQGCWEGNSNYFYTHDPVTNTYYEVKRRYHPQTGGYTVTQSHEISHDSYKRITSQVYRNHHNRWQRYQYQTAYNFVLSQVASDTLGANSLQSHDSANGYNVYQIAQNLKKGFYDTDSHEIRRIGGQENQETSDWQNALTKAKDGYFVFALYPGSAKKHGHVGILQPTTSDKQEKNINIFQAGHLLVK